MNFLGFVFLVLPFYLIWRYSPVIFVFLLVTFFAWIFYIFFEQNKKAKELEEMIEKMSPDERAAYDKRIEADRLEKETEAFLFLYGQVSPELICPHCQKKGSVHSKSYTKSNVIKGKVGGVLKTDINMSQVESGVQRFCRNCGTKWNVY